MYNKSLLLLKVLITCCLIILYYKIIKDFIYRMAPVIMKSLPISSQYSTIKIRGIIEIIGIAASHLMMATILLYFLGINLEQLGMHYPSFTELGYGILLGVSMAGISSIVCRFFIIVLIRMFPSSFPKDIKAWTTLAQGGWMRHHMYNFQILPIYFSVPILIMQITAEEIIFRGILINYFYSYGTLVTIMISTILFIYMQSFQMPSWTVAMFPMVGAFVSGIFFSVVYITTKGLISLIIAHCTFFLVSVI